MEAKAKAQYESKKHIEENAAPKLAPALGGLDPTALAETRKLADEIEAESKADLEAKKLAVGASGAGAGAGAEEVKEVKLLSKAEEKALIAQRIKGKRFSIISGAALGGTGEARGMLSLVSVLNPLTDSSLTGKSVAYGMTLEEKAKEDEERRRRLQEEQQHDESEAMAFAVEDGEDEESNQSEESEDDDFDDSYEVYLKEEEEKEAKEKKEKEEAEAKELKAKQDAKVKKEADMKAAAEQAAKGEKEREAKEEEKKKKKKNWHKKKKATHELDDSDYEQAVSDWCGFPLQLFRYELHVPMRMQAEVYQDRSLEFCLPGPNGRGRWEVLPVEMTTGITK
jgi:hypothetical protein